MVAIYEYVLLKSTFSLALVMVYLLFLESSLCRSSSGGARTSPTMRGPVASVSDYGPRSMFPVRDDGLGLLPAPAGLRRARAPAYSLATQGDHALLLSIAGSLFCVPGGSTSLGGLGGSAVRFTPKLGAMIHRLDFTSRSPANGASSASPGCS
jgi:hypothetical protein